MTTIQPRSREKVDLVAIDDINVLNPRSRNKRIHRELIENIQAIGLKRPITVSLRLKGSGKYKYDLVCGQGRLEAFKALSQTTIPAFVVDATPEDCLVMSLVENVARRHHQPVELMAEIGRLKERGHNATVIAERIGVTPSWVNMISVLLDRGEEKLLAAVETGLIPLSMATDIARSSGTEIQNLLSDAYEQGFRGKKLGALRRILEARAKRDKKVTTNQLGGGRASKNKRLTAADIRKMFEKEAEKRRLLVRKAAFTNERLVFATHAFKDLLQSSDFLRVLKAQSLDSIPKLLQTRIQQAGVSK